MCSIELFSKVALILGVICLQATALSSNSTNSTNLSRPTYFDGYSRDFLWIQQNFADIAPNASLQINESNYIHIGTALTLSFHTPNGPPGRGMSRAYRLFCEWINSRGGVNIGGQRYPVKLTLIDDESQPDKVESITRFLVQERGIKHFLGPVGNSLTRSAAQVVQELGAVMVAPHASSPHIYRNRPRVFGLKSPAVLALVSAIQVVADKGAKTIGYIEEAGKKESMHICGTVQPLSNQHGLQVVFNATVSNAGGEAAMNTAIVQMKERQPDVMVGCVQSQMCERLLQATHQQDFNVKAIILTQCVTRPGFFEANRGNVVNYGSFVLGVVDWHPSAHIQSEVTSFSSTDLAAQWTEVKKYGEVIPVPAVGAFVSAACLVRAMEIAGSTDPQKVAEALQNMDEMSVLGRIKFDNQGQVVKEYQTVQITASGVINVVAPQANANAPIFYPKPSWFGQPCLNSNPLRIGAFGLYPDGRCLECGENEIAPYNESLGVRVCKRLICEPGRSSVIFRSVQLKSEGAFCELCQRGHFVAEFGASQCESCAAGTYQGERGQTDCKPCPLGKYAASRGSTSCIACPAGSYTDAYSSFLCKRCPAGAICDADENGLFSNFSNAQGYFVFVPADTNYSEGQIYPCIHGKDGRSCVPGGCATDAEGTLKSEGPFCGRCTKGFGRTSVGGDCEKCTRLGKVVMVCLVSVFLLAFMAACIFILVLMTDLTRPRNMKAIIAKQVLNYISMVQIVSNHVELRIPLDFSFATDIFSWARVLGASGTAPFATQSGECLAQRVVGDEQSFRAYFILGVIAVPIWSVCCVLAFVVHRNYCFLTGKKPPRRSRLITLLIINLFVIHPPITELNLLAFKCYPFDEPRLLLDTSVVCFSDDHRTWQLLGFTGFVCYSLGIPLTTFLLLRWYKNRGKLQNRKTINTLGFLYSGFEDQFYYFESVFMLRKVLYQLLGVATFPGITSADKDENRLFSNMAMLFLATMFLALHIMCQPYDNRSYFTLDRIESGSLWAILITLLVQIFKQISDESYLFSSEEGMNKKARDIRDFTCTGIVIFFHAHFWFLTIFLMFRRRFEDERIEAGQKKRCTDYGDVVVEGYGLHVESLSHKARKSFTSMFEEMSLMFVEYEGGISCLEFFATLQYMCVDALYHRLRDKHIQTGAGLDHHVDISHEIGRMNWKERINFQLAVFWHHFIAWQIKKTAAIKKRWYKIQGVDKQREHPAYKHEKKKQEIMDELQRLQRFNARTFEHCIGQVFSVEELHLSMMRMSKELGKARAHADPNHKASKKSEKMTFIKSKTVRRQESPSSAVAELPTPGGDLTTAVSGSLVIGGTITPGHGSHTLFFPESPEVDISPEELETPETLGMVRQLETSLRMATVEVVQMQEEHERDMLDKDKKIEALHDQYAYLDDRIRRGDLQDSVSVSSASDETDINRSNSKGPQERECHTCKSRLSYHEGFCWNCGQMVKCDWRTIESQERRHDRATAVFLNEELQESLLKVQDQLEETMQKVNEQKAQLERHQVIIHDCHEAWEHNSGKIEAVRQDIEEMGAERITLADKLEEAQERLFAARMELNGKRGAQLEVAQAAPKVTARALNDLKATAAPAEPGASAGDDQNLVFRWLNAKQDSNKVVM